MCFSMINKKELQDMSEDKTTSIITKNEISAGVVSNAKDFIDCKKIEEQSQEIGKLLNKYKEGLTMIKNKLQKENSAFSNKDLSNLTALVVDHNFRSRTAFVKMLNNLKITTKEANNGFLALEELKHTNEPFSLILLEIDMPKMDGFELSARIRKNPEWDDTIIIVQTAAGQRGDAMRCRKLGIAAYLSQPISNSELLDILHNIQIMLKSKKRMDLITCHSIREKHKRLNLLSIENNRFLEAIRLVGE